MGLSLSRLPLISSWLSIKDSEQTKTTDTEINISRLFVQHRRKSLLGDSRALLTVSWLRIMTAICEKISLARAFPASSMRTEKIFSSRKISSLVSTNRDETLWHNLWILSEECGVLFYLIGVFRCISNAFEDITGGDGLELSMHVKAMKRFRKFPDVFESLKLRQARSEFF